MCSLKSRAMPDTCYINLKCSIKRISLPKDTGSTNTRTTLMTTDLPCAPLLWISWLSELARDRGLSVTLQESGLMELTGDWGMRKGLDWSEPTD